VSIHNHIQQIYSSSFVHFPGHATLSHAAATTPARAESAGVPGYRRTPKYGMRFWHLSVRNIITGDH
jgi:hypothetical protein